MFKQTARLWSHVYAGAPVSSTDYNRKIDKLCSMGFDKVRMPLFVLPSHIVSMVWVKSETEKVSCFNRSLDSLLSSFFFSSNFGKDFLVPVSLKVNNFVTLN